MKVFVTSEESFKTMQNRKCTPSDLSPTLEDSEKYLIGMATVTEYGCQTYFLMERQQRLHSVGIQRSDETVEKHEGLTGTLVQKSVLAPGNS